MEKYIPLKMGNKLSYCLSSKKDNGTKNISEFNVVLTNNIFKNKNSIKKLRNLKAELELKLMRKKEEHKSILIKINTLINIGMETQDEIKLDQISQLVKENKDKKIFAQREINEINKEMSSIDIEIVSLEKDKNNIITKYNLDSGSKFKSITCNKEDEEELKEMLEGFGCLVN